MKRCVNCCLVIVPLIPKCEQSLSKLVEVWSFPDCSPSLVLNGRPKGSSLFSILFFVLDSILHQLFIVRFLGSMEVKSDESPDVVYETMRQILAARAIHNVFRMTESHLVVTCDCLK